MVGFSQYLVVSDFGIAIRREYYYLNQEQDN
jgi:hypothetical protein